MDSVGWEEDADGLRSNSARFESAAYSNDGMFDRFDFSNHGKGFRIGARKSRMGPSGLGGRLARVRGWTAEPLGGSGVMIDLAGCGHERIGRFSKYGAASGS
jgi:hypothetical protein